MAVPAHPSLLVVAGVAVLIAWRMYSRFRRLVGRQRLSRVRPWITLVVFPLLLVLFALGAIAHPMALAALGGGVVIGAALGTWGLRLTKFEATPQGLFYTPNLHLGIALSSLFAARVLYRVVQWYFLDQSGAGAPDDFLRSPLTLAIFATLAGYYVRYAIGLILWRRATSPS
jgi:hypothetical protein